MKRVKYRKSLVASVIGIFLVFNILSILLFTLYAKQTTQGNAISYAKRSLLEIVEEKSELISIRFDRIESHVQVLGVWMEKVLREATIPEKLSDEYVFRGDGTIGRIEKKEKSSLEQSNLFVPNTVDNIDEIIREINATEALDEPFAQILKNEEVTWAYIATSNNLLRCSPYSNLQESFASNHSQSEDVFFTMANETNDPERRPVWTKPYTDYLGTGWTMTCSQPVYDSNDNLYGVICLDISIENIKEKYFEAFNLGRTGKVIWMDKNGNIFYHSDYNELAANQGSIYEKNIFSMKDISNEEKKMIQKVLKASCII